jgi:hypothetical protein
MRFIRCDWFGPGANNQEVDAQRRLSLLPTG